MKNPALWLLGCACWGVVSCSQGSMPQTSLPCKTSLTGDTLVMGVNRPEPLFITCNNKEIAYISQVMDSRCPEGATCIWAGKVNVMLQFNSGFSVNLEKGKQVDTSYSGRKYHFSLLDVTPYPKINVQVNPADQKIVLWIHRD